MEILRHDAIPSRQQGDERREYYQSDHFRAVVTYIPPGHTQNEHFHERLYDITWVLEGEVEVSERDDAGLHVERLGAEDMVVFFPGPSHNVVNRSGSPAKLFTLKFDRPRDLSRETFAVLCDGKDGQEADWHPYIPPTGSRS